MREVSGIQLRAVRMSNGEQGLEVLTDKETPTVVIRKAYKSFNKGEIQVMNDFSMTVQHGTIYSLLGSSGTGKTTTLNCIAGIDKLNSGRIHVFGRSPGSSGEGGVSWNRRVGYMPQEMSLYKEFSIAETLTFFGTLCGMKAQAIEERISFFTMLLNLPASARRVGSLSGGQMRRVSLCVSLIHGPKLLLLDEPTAGVDPLLRDVIWKHLISLSDFKHINEIAKATSSVLH